MGSHDLEAASSRMVGEGVEPAYPGCVPPVVQQRLVEQHAEDAVLGKGQKEVPVLEAPLEVLVVRPRLENRQPHEGAVIDEVRQLQPVYVVLGIIGIPLSRPKVRTCVYTNPASG